MELFEQGFALVSNFIGEANRLALVTQLEQLNLADLSGGIRNLDKKLPYLQTYLDGAEFKAQTQYLLPPGARLVRAILFNKTSTANWYVTWHQDKTVALSGVFADPSFRAWSLKDGVHHAQPPRALLEEMLTLRVHLDAATCENGCLKVIPGSHRLGVLTSEQIQAQVAGQTPVYCEAEQGAALVMRPLLIHASSKCAFPSQRRVLHLEFSDWRLPDGIDWG
jgi:hypothetical protein